MNSALKELLGPQEQKATSSSLGMEGLGTVMMWVLEYLSNHCKGRQCHDQWTMVLLVLQISHLMDVG